MASIRRTQSPAYRDRSHTNGFDFDTPFTHSSSHKLLYASNYYSSKQSFFNNLRKLVSGIFRQRPSRKPNHLWRWRFLLCFMLGLLYGLSPFRNLEENKEFLMMRNTQQSPSLPLSGVVSRRNVVLESVNLGLEMKKLEVDDNSSDIKPRKQLIVVTPTFNRALQGYYLNRLGQVLRLVPPPVLWIVVEMNEQEDETAEILRKIGVMNRHLVCTKNLTNIKDRGVHQRNTALDHIQQHRLDGIVYFADDDNIYSLELFESLREIRRFGTWPVAMLAQSKSKAILEGPVCNGSQVIGWHTNEKSKRLRRFHVDMSGFAFNSTILWDPKRWNRTTLHPIRQLDTVKEGFQETTFIEQVVEDEFQMEGLPHGCGRVMSWHLHLEARNLVYPKSWLLPNDLDVILPLDELQLQNV